MQMSNVNQETQQAEWLLNTLHNIPHQELRMTNMKIISEVQYMKVLEKPAMFTSNNIITFDVQQDGFTNSKFLLYPNMLIRQHKQIDFLILSSCQLEQKTIRYKNLACFGIILTNLIGQTYLFFSNFIAQREVFYKYEIILKWLKCIKQYIRGKDFHKKYQVLSQIKTKRFYHGIKKNTSNICINLQFSDKKVVVEIHRLFTLQKYQEKYEILMNRIHILMCIKDPVVLPFKRFYQEKEFFLLIYDQWNGLPLYKLLESGKKLTPLDQSKIIYQVSKFIKKLHGMGLAHCSINPKTVIVSLQNDVQVSLSNFSYKEVTPDYLKLLKEKSYNIFFPPNLIPYEIEEQNENQIQQQIDSYQIGCLMYYLQFYEFLTGFVEGTPLKKLLVDFKIDFQKLQKLNEDMKKNEPQSLDEDQIHHSKLQVMMELLHPDPEMRINITKALKHHYFTNLKSKFAQKQKKKNTIFDKSLRTILELREVSCREISKRFLQLRYDENENLHLLCQEENFLPFLIRNLNDQSVRNNLTLKK